MIAAASQQAQRDHHPAKKKASSFQKAHRQPSASAARMEEETASLTPGSGEPRTKTLTVRAAEPAEDAPETVELVSRASRDMEGALRSSLLDLMGSSQRVAPGAGGGWGLPSVDAFRNIPVMTPDGKHRESSWALHGRRGSPSPQRRKASPEKWESPFARHHPAARRR